MKKFVFILVIFSISIIICSCSTTKKVGIINTPSICIDSKKHIWGEPNTKSIWREQILTGTKNIFFVPKKTSVFFWGKNLPPLEWEVYPEEECQKVDKKERPDEFSFFAEKEGKYEVVFSCLEDPIIIIVGDMDYYEFIKMKFIGSDSIQNGFEYHFEIEEPAFKECYDDLVFFFFHNKEISLTSTFYQIRIIDSIT